MNTIGAGPHARRLLPHALLELVHHDNPSNQPMHATDSPTLPFAPFHPAVRSAQAAARAIWTVCRDYSAPHRNSFLPIKNNIASAACGLAYTIEPHPESGAPLVTWHPTPVTISPREALRSMPKSAPRPTEREEAREFLCQALADGPRPANRLLDEGKERGFHIRTLQRAFHDLEGHTDSHENQFALDQQRHAAAQANSS